MINNKSVLCLVLARKNSKGLPGKNLKKINGIPLVGISVKTARKSKHIDSIVLSTDCENIAKIGIKYGASVPFLRPKNLAKDTSKSEDVILHVLDKLDKTYDYLVLLEPTSPFTTTYDVDEAIRELENKSHFYKSLVSVSKVEASHPDFCYRLNKNNAITSYISKNKKSQPRRQDISKLFFCDGSLYISCIPSFKKYKSFFHDQTLAKIMPKWKSIEIDDYLDYVHALATIKNISKIRKYEEK
tara:strand:- start:37 stop:765 length:729 start_codon:yes stop_codon:yes gene_type:complete